VDIHVRYEGKPKNFVLNDGLGVLPFDSQPIKGITVYSRRIYRVTVSDNDTGCTFGNVPTGLPEVPQPGQLPYSAWIPAVGK
jgi:hypothetical protein